MFESLTDRLGGVFKKLGGRGRITEKEIDEALREVRVALLEADVNFKVAKDFIAKVRERVLAPGVLEGISPTQQVVKIVQEELTTVLGGASKGLSASNQPPTIVMMVGLQGSGKTTTSGKLAAYLKKQGQRPLLVAADVKRPAAVQQLVTLGKQLDIPVYEEGAAKRGVEVCVHALKRARDSDANWVILDTAGRLHIDEEMMGELAEIKEKVKPQEALLVVDAMTGQDAVRAAEQFHQRVALSGLVLTKIDGDARGGAALSITTVTGLPIKFLGTGEKLEAFEPYHPDRLASRIMGMGDMATLIERAQEVIDPDQAKALEKKIRAADFSLDDLLEQLRQVKKMGSIGQVLDMVPGMKFLSKRLPTQEVGDRQLARTEAVILSMTPHERKHPEVIGSSRRRRIATGSGTTTAEVNRLLEQYQQMKKLLKQFSGKGGKPARLPSIPGRIK